MPLSSVHLSAIARLQPRLAAAQRLCVGIDTVQVSALQASLDSLGERFVRRLFTAGEQALAAQSMARRAERLAARFAAKEATLKAFGLTEAGIDWREIEVGSEADGRPVLVLHGKAAALVGRLGASDVSLSLSHDGDQACAIVVAIVAERSDIDIASDSALRRPPTTSS